MGENGVVPDDLHGIVGVEATIGRISPILRRILESNQAQLAQFRELMEKTDSLAVENKALVVKHDELMEANKVAWKLYEEEKTKNERLVGIPGHSMKINGADQGNSLRKRMKKLSLDNRCATFLRMGR